MIYKKLVCKVCGCEFFPEKDEHYIARDKELIGGLAASISNSEPNIYDAFDCPNCGCQVIAHERKMEKEIYFDANDLILPGVPAPAEEDDLK